MAGSEIRAGKAFVEIAEKGFKETQAKIKAIGTTAKETGEKISSLGKGLIGIGLSVAAPMAAALHIYDEIGSKALDGAAKANMSVEAYTGLAYAFEQTGNSAEDLQGASAKMTKHLVEAIGGSQEATDSFAKLGLSADSLSKMSADKQFLNIAQAISKVKDPLQQAAAAQAMFGKSGMGLLPTIKDGAEGLSQLVGRAKELGYSLSGEDAGAAEEFGDLLSDIGRSVKMVAFHIGAALAPVLKPMINDFLTVSKSTMDWIGQNAGLIVSIGKFAAITIGAGAALFIIGSAIAGLGTVITGAVGAVGAIISGIMTFGGVILAVVSSPITLIVGAVAGLAIAIGELGSTVGGQTESMGEMWGNMSSEFGGAWNLIVDSVMSGNLSGAFEAVWGLIKALWAEGWGYLSQQLTSFTDGWANVWNETTGFLAKVWTGIIWVIEDSWSATCDGFKQAWYATVTYLSDVWESFKTGLAKGWLWFKNLIGVMKDEEYNAEKKKLEEASAQVHKDNADWEDKKSKASTHLRNKERNAYDKETFGTMTAIDEDTKNAQKARAKASADALARTHANTVAARADFDRTQKEINEENKKAKQKKSDEKAKSIPKNGEEGLAQVAEAAKITYKHTSAGTFSAFGVAGLGTTDVQIDLLRQIAKNTKDNKIVAK